MRDILCEGEVKSDDGTKAGNVLCDGGVRSNVILCAVRRLTNIIAGDVRSNEVCGVRMCSSSNFPGNLNVLNCP